MVQLLHKYSITAAESSVKLMKVIKSPVSDHLPAGERMVQHRAEIQLTLLLSGCRKILMSYSAEGVKRPAELVPETEQPICIVVGAIAKVITATPRIYRVI